MDRGIWVHVGLLVVACGASLYVWTRDPKASAATRGDVTVWNGRSADVQRLRFVAAGKTITLEARKDGAGRWFEGTVESRVSVAADAGAPPSPHTQDGAGATKTTSFVSISSAEKIADALAPFRAVREVGRVDAARAAEFGLIERSSTLEVDIAGTQHRLTLGALTPSGSDRYVRDEASGEVYAVHGEFTRDLDSGEPALAEHEAHGFADADLESVRIVAGGKTREMLRRGPAGKRIWADPATPDKADETVSNWLSKVDRLHVFEYIGDPRPKYDPILRIDYTVNGAQGVFLELARGPAPGESGKADYFLRSERTRLWAKLLPPGADQVEQDLASVMNAGK